MHRVFIILAIGSVIATAAPAQSVRWDPPGGQLGFNQLSELALVFENCEPDPDQLKLPTVDGLVFSRPSTSSQTSIINFKMTRTFSYVFPVRPTQRRSISIPAFEISTDKGLLRVSAATYAVGDATVGNSGLAINDVVSAKLTMSKDTLWAGEVIPFTYHLSVVRRYYHSLASNINWLAGPLLVEEWSKPEPVETLVGGERRVVSMQTTRALARQPGTFTLKPATQMVNLMVGTSGFGLFSAPTVEQRQIETEPLAITVRPLPPASAEFSGAVGEFSLVSKFVPTTSAVGEPVTWTLELSGTGNWPDIAGLPQREVSGDFQVVQPKSKRTMKDNSLFEGTLSEDVVLVPTRPGRYTIAPVRFTYFDTKTGTYKTLASEPVTVTVAAGTQSALTQPTAPGGPVQFSLGGATLAPTSSVAPSAVPPVPPERLPRDPLAAGARGYAPLDSRPFWLLVTVPAGTLVLSVWLLLAALRSRVNDPQRRRREARRTLAATLAKLNSTPLPASRSSLLHEWQRHTAALWEIPHAAPGTRLVHACVATRLRDAAPAWSQLWSEADRALHGPDTTLPSDWALRADGALQAVRVPGWPPSSLFAPRNLLPFFLTLAVLLLPVPALADNAADAYKRGDFPAAEAAWRKTVATTPEDWAARHNLGLALAQQDRWAEAAAHWTAVFLLAPRAEEARWDLALGLQRSGLAPAELVDFSRGEGRHALARLASPGEWQLAFVGASLLLATALIVLLLQGYGRIGRWARPAALAVCLLAVLLAAAATLCLRNYGQLAEPDVAMVWRPSLLRSIPTEADTSQKTSPLSAGSIAVADKAFLGWSRLTFAGGQIGWVRTEDLLKLYR